jgi:phosphomannomutase
MASVCRDRGKSVLDLLETVYRRFGLCLNSQKSLTLPGSEGSARIHGLLEVLRDRPPRAIGGRAVRAESDLVRGTRRETGTGREAPIELPRSDVLVYELAEGGRVLVRPSGTEPKIKFYFEVVEPIAPDESFSVAETRARERRAALEAGFLSLVETLMP